MSARTAAVLAMACLVVQVRSARGDELPMEDVAPHRDPSGQFLEAVAVGLPDTSLPTFESRCRSARERAESRATEALLRHVDAVLERASATPPTFARVREAVTRNAQVTSRRPLVDCGMVVSMRVPVADLSSAAPGVGGAF